MKKLLLTSALIACSLGAFAQGKVNLLNDAASLVTLTGNSSLALAGDQGQLGQAVGNISPLASGVTLIAGLYGGTSQGSLFLYPTTYLMNAGSAGSAGVTGPLHILLNASAATGAPLINGIPSNTPIGASTPWFQVRVWDSAYATYALALAAGSYTGQGAEFQMNPGNSIAYINTSPSANSTWVDAPIVVSLVPEPSTFALAGLGAAAMLIFRRRK